MSTSYYKLNDPFTHVFVGRTDDPDECSLHVHVNGKRAGVLLLTKEELRLVLNCLFDRNILKAPYRTHWGGADAGSVVTENVRLPDHTVLMSEYGDLLTVAQIKARHGAKRSDGMPTELFGYEKSK